MATLSEKEIEQVLKEIRILASLNHKNIIGYKHSFSHQQTNTLIIIMEYAEDGDIESKIKYKKTFILFRIHNMELGNSNIRRNILSSFK